MASDFLKYQDSEGQFVDFHSLRHTRGVWLFKHHNAGPRDAQELMGLGSLALVDRYSRSFKNDHRALVNNGPQLRRPAITTAEAGNVDMLPESLPLSLPQIDGTERISVHSGGLPIARTSADSEGAAAQKSPEKPSVLTFSEESAMVLDPSGEVAEWLNAPVSKTG